MHLLSITNVDYGMMSILFALILITAYCFRRKNRTSNDFLLAQTHYLNPVVIFSALGGLGLVEFIVASSYGAFGGLTAIYLALPTVIVLSVIFDYRAKIAAPLRNVLNDDKPLLKTQVFLACYSLVMLLAAGIAISVMVGMLYSLLGWQFGNSTLSLMGIVLVFILLGGVVGVFYNQAIVNVVMVITLIVVLFIANHNLPTNLVSSLQTVASENSLAKDSFINISHFSMTQLWLVIVAIAGLLILNPLWWSKAQKLGQRKAGWGRVIQWAILALMILLGIFALATPGKQPVLHGQKVMTQQTRLADGSLGFVVKVVPSDGKINQLGIIPKQMNDENELAATGSSGNPNDFISAGMVMTGTALSLAFVSLYVIMSLFIKTMSESIAFITQALIKGFYAPYFNKSGDDLENLWAARVFIFALSVVMIAVGLVLYKFYDLYFALSLLLVLAFPLALNFLGLSKTWLVDVINYLSLVVIWALVGLPNVPSLLPLIQFPSLAAFVVYLTGGSFLFYGLSWLILTAWRR